MCAYTCNMNMHASTCAHTNKHVYKWCMHACKVPYMCACIYACSYSTCIFPQFLLLFKLYIHLDVFTTTFMHVWLAFYCAIHSDLLCNYILWYLWKLQPYDPSKRGIRKHAMNNESMNNALSHWIKITTMHYAGYRRDIDVHTTSIIIVII